MNNRAIAIVTVAFYTIVMLFASGAVAQEEQEQPNLAEVWMVVVKDGMDDEFSEAFKEHLKYRARKEDPRAWKTYVPIIGDDLDHYAIRYCCVSYADMDGYRNWAQKANIGDHWNETVDRYVASYRHYLNTVDMENSNWPDEDPGFELFGVTRYDQKMGMGQSVEASKVALSVSAKEGGWPRNWAWQSTTGGSSGQLQLVVPYRNYADMEPPEESFGAFLARRHGEDEARRMISAFTDNFSGADYTVYRLLPDMSMDE